MRDPDPDLRIQAALALGTQRGPEAVEALLHGARRCRTRTSASTRSSRSAGWRPAAAIEPLTAIAESRDFFLAFPAIEALVRINDPLVGATPRAAAPRSDARRRLPPKRSARSATKTLSAPLVSRR